MVDGGRWVAWFCLLCGGGARVILTTTATTAAVAWAPMARNTSTVASGRLTDLPSNESNKGRGDSMQVHPCHLTFSSRPVRALLLEASVADNV